MIKGTFSGVFLIKQMWAYTDAQSVSHSAQQPAAQFILYYYDSSYIIISFAVIPK
jgi:hypothetical protein